MKRFFISLTMLLGTLSMQAQGWPSQYEGVMLQGFYWDSFSQSQWVKLEKQADELSRYFTLVWLPQSANCGGTSMGYDDMYWFPGHYDSSFGSEAELRSLINTFKSKGIGTIADVVINHRKNVSNWVDFPSETYQGVTYQLLSTDICANDDGGKTKTWATQNGYSLSVNNDTGDGWDGMRDLDHKSEYVQGWSKAYVQWLLNTMKYDGFRYDMTLGFHGRYLSMYNVAAQPYMSVSELWHSIDRQKQHLQECDSNTMIFDFQAKYSMKGIVTGSYGKLNASKTFEGLRKHGLARYSVTFIDNHDTFDRGGAYGDNQFSGSDLSNSTTKDQILQASAYMLMMPGVPCVFYPHWVSYKEEINELIAIRKRAGIHSESEVLAEESGQYKYHATIQGHRGKVIVRVGKYRSQTVPEGYELAVEGGDRGAYTVYIAMNPQGIANPSLTLPSREGKKFVENGKLYIRHGEHVYDIFGRIIQ